MNLTSGLFKRYRKAFILDEDGLRRVHGVLEKAAKDIDGNPQVVFHVERDDDRYYESTSVEDVLADPNVAGKRVKMAGISLRRQSHAPPAKWPEDESIVQVTFCSAVTESESPFPDYNRVSIRIATEDKNWALLLADNLQPQVERTFKARATPRWLLLLFVLPFLMAMAKTVLLRTTFKATDVFMGIFLPSSLGTMLYMLSRLSGPPHWFVKAFGPESAFVWGEELQSYPDREQTRRNVMWAVVVAFLVTFAGSIVFAMSGISGAKEPGSPTKTSTGSAGAASSAVPVVP